jgi:hypothetical protein
LVINVVVCEFVLPELLSRFLNLTGSRLVWPTTSASLLCFTDVIGDVQSPQRAHLPEEGSAARLDSLNLGHVERLVTEAGRKLREVEEDAVRRLDRAQFGTSGTANAASRSANCLLKRTVLLGVVAVGAEGAVARARAEAIGE